MSHVNPSRAAWLGGISALAFTASRAQAQTLTPITVACGLVEGHAQPRYALAQGIFRKHGLDAHILTQNNGAAMAAAVVGGTAQFGISNVLQLAQAHANNVPLKIVALASINDAKAALSGLVVAANAGIANARDLTGKTVGVSSLRGLDQLQSVTFIDKRGGDSKSVRFIELPPTAALEAILAGRVSAAVVVPPMLETALANDRLRSIGDVEAAIAPLWVPSGWFSSAEYLAANADVARRFAAAIYEAGVWAMANRAAAAKVLSDALGSPVPQTYQHFATKTDPALLRAPLEDAAHYGYVAETRPADLLWSGS